MCLIKPVQNCHLAAQRPSQTPFNILLYRTQREKRGKECTSWPTRDQSLSRLMMGWWYWFFLMLKCLIPTCMPGNCKAQCWWLGVDSFVFK